MKSIFENVSDNGQYIKELVARTASNDRATAFQAQAEFATVLQGAIRSALLVGDNRQVFNAVEFGPTEEIEYPVDAIAPGEEDELVAFTVPNQGRIPEKTFEADYVKIPTYRSANAIDWELRAVRNGGANVIQGFIRGMANGFVQKQNDDAWHTLLAAAADRNILVYDADATAGLFTKRLVSLLKTTVRRNGGGNAQSMVQFKLTDLFTSIECIEDMRSWGVDQVDEITRREIYVAADGSLNRIFSVNLHGMTEFGEGQKYQQYFTEQLGGSLAASDLELLIGLDLETVESLVMPVREQVTIFDDPTLHRQQRQGYYGWGEWGFACLDNRCVIAGSC